MPTGWAIAQAKPLKVGLMLPYSGTFAKLGENITIAIEMLIAEKGGKLGGREIQIVKLDDESKPENGAAERRPPGQARQRRRADRHRALGRADGHPQGGAGERHADHRPNAGNDAVTRELCAKNVFRTSFTNWQPAYGMGLALGKKGVKKAAWVTWDYAAGPKRRRLQGRLREGRRPGRADLTLKFPQTNFQPLLAQIPGLGVDVVGAFFAGGGAVQFVKEYAAAGIKVPLCGSAS